VLPVPPTASGAWEASPQQSLMGTRRPGTQVTLSRPPPSPAWRRRRPSRRAGTPSRTTRRV